MGKGVLLNGITIPMGTCRYIYPLLHLLSAGYFLDIQSISTSSAQNNLKLQANSTQANLIPQATSTSTSQANSTSLYPNKTADNMGFGQSRIESTSRTGASRTPRPSRTSSPSRIRSRSPAIDGFRAGRDWSEPYRRSRWSHGSSSRAPRVPGSGPDYDQGEVRYPSRHSYGISSSRAPRIPESGLNYHQGGLRQSSRRARRSSSRAPRVPESRLDYDQGEVRYPSRQSYGISSGADHVPGSRPNYEQGEDHYPSRRSYGSSSRAPRAPESRMDYHQDEADYPSRQSYGISNGAHHVPGSRLNYEQGEAHYPSRPSYGISSEAPRVRESRLDYHQDEAQYPSRQSNGTSSRAPGFPLDYQDESHYPSRQSYGSSSRTPGVVERQVHYQGESHHSSRQSYSSSSRAPRVGGFRPDHPRLRRTPHTRRSPRFWGRGTGYRPGYDGVEPSFVPVYDPASGIFAPFVPEGTLPTRQRSNFEGAPSLIRQYYDPEEVEPRRPRWTFNPGSSNHTDAVARGRIDPEESFATRRWFDPSFGGSGDASDEDEAPRRHPESYHIPQDYEPFDRHGLQRSAMVDSLGARSRFSTVDTATLEEGDQLCPICTNRYSVPTVITPSGSSDTENAVRTPCHHVIGRNCLRRWLAMGKTTCPICRANLLER
ncbi:Serine/arginine repetitive matrix protein 2 [Pseudocyphellaria aurata]|nr:Serine/arginine repetitive matrix protein 2 [Pseudocyphellaria aurata]